MALSVYELIIRISVLVVFIQRAKGTCPVTATCGGSTDNIDNNNAGTTYVRWGRTICPETACLVYAGQMGNSFYTHAGGGSNYLCLVKDPENPTGVTAGVQSGSSVYGVEYQQQNSPLIPSELHDEDAPCAVCEVYGRGKLLMIPGKFSCPQGWTKEYQGILMAHHNTHNKSEFICVSQGMEAVPGGSANNNGALLYVVEAACGALKCPPYVAGYEIACAVCTK